MIGCADAQPGIHERYRDWIRPAAAIRHFRRGIRDFALFTAIHAALATVAMADSAETVRVRHQGVERTAVLFRPESARAAMRPLVMALHGLGGNSERLRQRYQFEPIATREGFAVLYPNALEGRWSYGRPIVNPMPSLNGKPVDDIGLLRALIEDLVTRGITDPARVYVTGMSRGALMAFTLACALAERIAAAAPIASSMTEHQRAECRPSRLIPIMLIAGTHDHTQEYDGWLYRGGRLLSVPETMEHWRTLHGCSTQQGRRLPHRDDRDHTRVILIEWSSCSSGTQLRLYRIDGGGHQIPLISDESLPLPRRFGARNRDIEAAEEIWNFVKTHTR